LAKGAEINPKNSDGNTPLHLAIIAECAPSVALLQSKGADGSARNGEGHRTIEKY